MHVPFVDLKAQYRSIQPAIDGAMASVLSETAFVRGKYVSAFEAAFAEAAGSRHCISCANGTDAIFIALKMQGIGPGDEVITTANSWISTSETISLTGATPVFVDLEDAFYCLDPALIEAKITPRTKAILPVHLLGQPAAMDEILALAEKHGLVVIEDCAQAHLAEYRGRRIGLMGLAGTFSFYPGKNLGAYGDAGAIITDDDDFAAKCRMFANHGADRANKHDHQMEGICSRMDGLQAAILSAKLPHLRAWTEARRAAAARYGKLLEGIPGIVTPGVREGAAHVYHVYCIRAPRRDELQEALKAAGIETTRHYPTPLPLLTAYKRLGHTASDFPVACRHAREILSLPIFPEITEEQQAAVAGVIREFSRS
jgi:dTDP-4-amino-4,6-dideoxygalactose transaminase